MAPHRSRAYLANKTQPALVSKQNSVTAWIRLVMETAQNTICSVTAPKFKEVPLRNNVKKFVGIDIASETLAMSIYEAPSEQVVTKADVPNNDEGFQMMRSWFKEHGIKTAASVICMEATGVYGERLTHYLASEGFQVAVEPPLKVKRAFDQDGHKTDPVDSAQIAEYAYRFFDELRFWEAPTEITEKMKHYLSARELLTKQSVAIQNAIVSYKRHAIQEQQILEMYQNNLALIKEQIKKVERRVDELVKSNPSFHQLSMILVSVCGVGTLLAAYLLVTTNGFQNIHDYKQMAAFLGICPYKFKSGKSVNRKDRSRGFGPAYIRKLLHLAARSMATHNPEFRQYYLRKLAEGKSKSTALNNIGNKLIKICFAVVRDRKPYIKGYRSIHPELLKSM